MWLRLLDSNQWPHACEDSIGTSCAGFRENKADLPQGFIPRRYALFRCFRPGFSVRGSRRGSKHDPRFLIAPGRALSYSKAGFLTEYAELGKMQSGAARTAGGWLHHPKGGAAYANHITYWSLYGDNHCEKQKPPLWQVTVSGHSFELVTY